jgi:hypothetical protein
MNEPRPALARTPQAKSPAANRRFLPAEPDYWPPVDREVVLTLDDILLEDGKVAPFSPTETTYAAMGRFVDFCSFRRRRRACRAGPR